MFGGSPGQSGNEEDVSFGGCFRGIGAVGSALPWHGRGQGFESPMLHHVRLYGHPMRLVDDDGGF